MKFEELNENEYNEFAFNHKYISIYQLPAWGKLKESTGWNYYFVGLKKDNNIIGVTLLLRKKILKNLYLFYAPRGYLFDIDNKDIFNVFHKNIINFVKLHHGFMLKVDPNVIYNIRDKENNIISRVGNAPFNNFINNGYKHLGFTLNFETMQPRYVCRYRILDTYEDTFKTFSKSTQKNTLKAYEMGVQCKKIDSEHIDEFMKEIRKTAETKHFIIRPTWYYKKILELFPDNVKYFIAYIDTNIYYNNILNNINIYKEKVCEINNKINKYANVGEKLHHELEIANNSLNKCELELETAKKLKAKNSFINIGALMSVFTGNEGITFMSGTDSNYKNFFIKYAFYDAHLRESIKQKKEFVNFYGISGDMNKDHEYYNIYELKKGYNPEIIELLGEFDYILNKPKYFLYNLFLRGYKILKKLKH